MASFVFYDVTFLILFCIGVALFLYKNRKKLDKEGIVLLYRTKMGLDTIDAIGKRHPKLLAFLSIFVVIAGYLMMTAAVFSFVAIVLLMLNAPTLPKIPPLIPLVPYIDRLLPSGLLPPFYFTYWIIVIAIVAVFHEFAHGVFAKIRNIRIKSTGFGFIGPLLAAFVELDEKQMAKKPIKDQLAVIAAGSSANLVLWLIFSIISVAFFAAAFVPNGVYFSTYMVEPVSLSQVSSIGNLSTAGGFINFEEFAKAANSLNQSELKIMANNKTYFTNRETVLLQRDYVKRAKIEATTVALYTDTPAYHANLSGAIQEMSTQNMTYKITDMDSLQNVLNKLKPNETLNIRTSEGNYTLTLIKHPLDNTKGFLGIGFSKVRERWTGKLASLFSHKNPFVLYEPKGNGTNGSIVVFIYNLLYWLMIINFFVMLFNMLPVGIVDGGRFFYLTALVIVKSEKKAAKIFGAATWLILACFIAIIGVWLVKAF